jgi:transposase
VHWKPVWHVLEDDFELMLDNARHVKQVPGRKTDMSDAAWLCQLAEAGLLKANFVPPKPIRDLRQLTRYRKTQIAERQREAQRLHTALEDTNIRLDCVATDLLGKSARAVLDALVHGTTDPEILADLAEGRPRQKLPALREALEGRFNALHALLIGAILAHLDFLDEQIDRLSEAIEARIAPFEPAVELLCTIPGVQRRTAEVILAEIGPDMTVFPTARHLASWAGQCPGNDRSAGKQRSGRTRKGSRWLNAALKDAAKAAIRTKNSYLRALYERQRSRATPKRSAPSNTRSSSPSGTCSPTASSTTTSDPTTPDAATPPAPPNASSPSSSASDTPSPSRRQPHRAPTHFPLSGAQVLCVRRDDPKHLPSGVSLCGALRHQRPSVCATSLRHPASKGRKPWGRSRRRADRGAASAADAGIDGNGEAAARSSALRFPGPRGYGWRIIRHPLSRSTLPADGAGRTRSWCAPSRRRGAQGARRGAAHSGRPALVRPLAWPR